MTKFEWDETKRIRTFADRELDFPDSTALFDGRPSVVLGAERDGEARWLTVGLLDDEKCYTVVWTQREHAVRIISFRRSHDDEERTYHACHG
jgi:uncharacterized protein